MLQKTIASMLLFALTLSLTFATGRLATDDSAGAKNSADKIQQIKSLVAKYDQVDNPEIKVTLKDKTKVQGYVRKVDNDSFTVVDKSSRADRIIAFSEVEKIKGPNGGLSTGAKVGIGLGIAGGAIAIGLVSLLVIWSNN